MAIIERTLIYPEYAISLLLAIVIAALFPVMKEIRQPVQRRQYIFLQIITLMGAVIGCKLAVLFGESVWPFAEAAAWPQILFGGRSILGALIFGLLAAEIAKPLIGYTLPPNDRFAALLPFTLAIGRAGCLLHGCCRGIPHEGWCTITYSDGIARYPAPALEMTFDLCVGLCFVWIVKRGLGGGRLFSIFLILYGVFRFASEFIRETPKLYGGWLSGYQVLSCVAVVVGLVFLMGRQRRGTGVSPVIQTKTTGETPVPQTPLPAPHPNPLP